MAQTLPGMVKRAISRDHDVLARSYPHVSSSERL